MDRRTVVITGGSSGIGRACALKFAGEGASVYELSRHGSNFDKVKHIPCDITDESSISFAMNDIDKREGKIDVLINNAGFGISGAIEFTKIPDIKSQFDVNVFGAVSITKKALPLLRKCHGKVFFISSAAAVFPIPFQSFYAASKSATNSISYALKNELSPFGIGVCALMPGDVKTGFTDARSHCDEGKELYGQRMSKAITTMENDERNGMSPEYIANAVYKYSLKSRLRPSYTIGAKYKLFYMLYRLLPFSVVNWLIGKIYG